MKKIQTLNGLLDNPKASSLTHARREASVVLVLFKNEISML